MKEILLTSSALILALLVMRRLFHEKISRRVQYALWGFVLLRLLLPVQLPAADFSILSVSEPARAQVAERLEQEPVYVLPVKIDRWNHPMEDYSPGEEIDWTGTGHTVVSEDRENFVTYAFTLQEALDLTWKIGMGVMGAWMLLANLRFWRKLRKSRIPLELPECRYPVYLMEEGLVSPCLFGLVRPAVYLTPAAMENEESLRHVLAHEEAHGRHWDPLWALLRNVCLAVYWFDPLVWWAAAASKEDCELACDESALARLGEDQRIPYGQTLLRLIPLQRARGGVILTATTMTSDKKKMKERIMRIAENKKMKTAALLAALALTIGVCAVTFTGCEAQAAPEPAAPVKQAADRPVTTPSDMPTLPSDALRIPLDDLQPVELQKVELISAETVYTGHHGDDHSDGHHEAQRSTRCEGDGTRTAAGCGIFAWTYGNMTYISSQKLTSSAYPDDYFLCFENEDCVVEPFTDVFGYDGVMIAYNDIMEDSDLYGTINDYYLFEENGDGSTDVYLLARVYGIPELIDLNGDGVNELVGTNCLLHAQIFFQRKGGIYEANIPALLKAQWSPTTQFMFTGWYSEHQLLRIYGEKPVVYEGQETDVHATFYRDVYFNGDSLLISKTPRAEMGDHILASVQDNSAAVDAARAAAKRNADAWTSQYNEGMENPPEWDDYCVTSLDWVYPEFEAGQPEGGPSYAVYEYQYEVHTSTPERIDMLAGGAWLDEDGWVGGFYDANSHYLVFQILDDGSYKLLTGPGQIPGDCAPGSSRFAEAVKQILTYNGLT